MQQKNRPYKRIQQVGEKNIHFKINDYCLQNLKIWGRDHFSFWSMLIGICIHLDARYKVAEDATEKQAI